MWKDKIDGTSEPVEKIVYVVGTSSDFRSPNDAIQNDQSHSFQRRKQRNKHRHMIAVWKEASQTGGRGLGWQAGVYDHHHHTKMASVWPEIHRIIVQHTGGSRLVNINTNG